MLIAGFHGRDARHADALPVLLAADAGRHAPLVLTDFILAETINFLTRKGGSAVGRDALSRLEASAGFRIERVPDAVFASGKDDVFKSIDGLSLVDAITVAHMRHRGIRRILTFDEGFDHVRGVERVESVT